jgi:N-acylglucosamine-6-phosphate 2-epimerase
MSTLDGLRGGLIVSVQAWRGSALDDPVVIAAMARAAQDGGAVAVRVAGVEHLRAVRERVALPVIGLIKREYPGFEPYITPTLAEVRAVIATGADVVAFDATARPRPGDAKVADAIETIHASGRLAMADCATAADAFVAARLGADVIATTLAGYTADTKGRPLPDLDLVRELAAIVGFKICEGGIRSPQQVRAALDAGADAVVVGTAISNVDWLVREFAGSTDRVS